MMITGALTRTLRAAALRLAAAAAALTLPAAALAQFDTQLSQYWATPTYYNAGAAGQIDSIRIIGIGRLQWVGIDNAPQSFVGLADCPFKIGGKRVGAGIAVMQESAGLYSSLDFTLQFAYKLKLFKGTLSIGLELGLISETFKGSDAYIPDDDDYHESSDEAIPSSDVNGTVFDLSAGVFYTHPLFWAGVSVKHFTEPTVTMSSDSDTETQYEFQTGRTCYFMAGSNIPIKNTLFEIQPSMMAKTDFTFFSAEITARAVYNHLLSGGLAYRWQDALSILLGVEYKSFFIGYAYDYPLSNISKASSGSHEFMLRYNVKLDLSDKNKNKHKSIRIM